MSMQSCLGWRTRHFSQNAVVTADNVFASTTLVSDHLKSRSEVFWVRCCTRDWVKSMAVVSSFPNRARKTFMHRKGAPSVATKVKKEETVPPRILTALGHFHSAALTRLTPSRSRPPTRRHSS